MPPSDLPAVPKPWVRAEPYKAQTEYRSTGNQSGPRYANRAGILDCMSSWASGSLSTRVTSCGCILTSLRSQLYSMYRKTQVTRAPWRAAIRPSSADHEIHDLSRHVDELPHRLPGQVRRDPIRGQRRRARIRLGGVAGELDASAHLAVYLDGELDHVVDREGLVPRWPGLVRERRRVAEMPPQLLGDVRRERRDEEDQRPHRLAWRREEAGEVVHEDHEG